MSTTILLEQPIFDQSGVLTLHLDRQVKVKISSNDAQKRVTRFVHSEISSQMHAEEPSLILGEETCWRVPVHLTLPAFGDIGCVGHIELDPLTGTMNILPATLLRISQKAEELALRFTSPTTQSI